MLRRLILLACLMACARNDGITTVGDLTADPGGDVRRSMLLVEVLNSPAWAADPLTITDARIDGDTLRLSVTYGGGCRQHSFQPLAGTAWMESYPVQVSARLAHNAGGDLCRALIHRALHIDLQPLKSRYMLSYQSASGRIAIRLEGAPAVLEYAF